MSATKIKTLGGLRKLRMSGDWIGAAEEAGLSLAHSEILCGSILPDTTRLSYFIDLREPVFTQVFQANIRRAKEKDGKRTRPVQLKLSDFACIGTVALKKRLKKDGSVRAQILHLALDIERQHSYLDRSYGEYKEKLERSKDRFIYKLIQLCKESGIIYGVANLTIPTRICFSLFEFGMVSWPIPWASADYRYYPKWDQVVSLEENHTALEKMSLNFVEFWEAQKV